MSENKVLLVDDDTNLLASLRRHLISNFEIVTAESGAAALKTLSSEGPFAVAVCDMRMPGMDGVTLLSEIMRLSPDTSRIMLTGNTDQQSAIDAVNRGQITRFLNKPCAIGVLEQAIHAGLRLNMLIRSERALLEGTLAGSISLMMEILSLAAPESFERALRFRAWALRIAEHLQASDVWELELCASLARIGEVTVPPEVLARYRSRQPLSPVELDIMDRVPDVGAQLIRRIPRLTRVAEAVQYQSKWFDGEESSLLRSTGKEIPFGGRVVSVLMALDEAGGGRLTSKALSSLAKAPVGRFDPFVVNAAASALKGFIEDDSTTVVLEVPANGLMPGDLLLLDLKLQDGRLVLAAGQMISNPVFLRIKNLRSMYKFDEPIRVKRSSRNI
jgi:response regulator RpfG family c-di-GMP phosphodiesterase